jgi:hypothetical protein
VANYEARTERRAEEKVAAARVAAAMRGVADAYWDPLPRYLICVAMNFGGTNSPHAFQKMMREPVRELRRELGKLRWVGA